jgi:hypothetical protein
MLMIDKSVICEEHTDCFANSHGKCICLSDNDFGDKDCPFYKNREKRNMELRKEKR